MKQRRSLFLLLALIALVVAVWSYILVATPPQQTLDQRVYYCQNESVADSSASIAEEMRLVIRQQLQAGASEQQVLRYFAAHYGNQILLTPPPQGFNLLAWLMPVAMLLIGLGLLTFVVRDWRAPGRTQQATSAGPENVEPRLDPELEQYRAQLEQELADDDPPMEIE